MPLGPTLCQLELAPLHILGALEDLLAIRYVQYANLLII